ncbi:serine hydrolase FSH [Trichoderma barbatum]
MSEDLTLPRILCLHGAGVNAEIFRIQCRAIMGKLKGKFRFIFVDGHLEDDPHEAVVTVFGEFAPFKRWLAYRDEHEPLDSVETSQNIAKQISDAMQDDKGTGEWAGLLGFSQGGVISSSLLWAQDHIEDNSKRPLPGIKFRFAVLMAAPGPVLHIDRTGTLPKPRHLASAGEVVPKFTDWPEEDQEDETHLVTTPTLHIHGLRDPALQNHRKLYKYSKKGTSMLLEWDGDHRLPIKPDDVSRTVSRILQLAERTGMDFYYDDDDW